MALLSRKRTRIALVLLLLLVLGAGAALRTQAAGDEACRLARRYLPGLLGLEVEVERCELDPLAQRLVLQGVSLAAPGAPAPLFSAEVVRVQLGLLRPSRVSLASLEVQRPRLALDLSEPAPAAPGGSGRCVLAPFEHVRVGRLEVRDAELSLALPGGRRVELGGLDVGWRERWSGLELEVEARRGVLAPGGGATELALGQLSVSGTLDPDDELLELDRVQLALDDVTLEVKGRVETLCAPRLALDAQAFVPLHTLARVAGLPGAARGQVWMRAGLQGPVESLDVRAELAATGTGYGRFAPGDFNARLALKGREVTLEELSVPAGEGVVRVRGTVRLEPQLPARLLVEAERASFARIMAKAGRPGAWVEFLAGASGSLTGTLLPRPALAGPIDAQVEGFVLTARPFDAPPAAGRTLLTLPRGRILSRLEVLGDRATFGELEVSSGNSHVEGEVTLFYDPARGLLVEGEGELDLGDSGAIAELPWAGRGSARFRVEGPYRDVTVDAQLAMRDFVFWQYSLGVVEGSLHYEDFELRLPHLTAQKGHSPYSGDVAVRFKPQLHLRLQADAPQARAEDLLDLIAGVHPFVPLFQGSVAGRARVRVSLDAPVSRLAGTIDVALQDATYYGRRVGSGSAHLRFEDGKALLLERAALAGPAGRGWAEGAFRFASRALDYRFGAERLSLAELMGRAAAERMGVAGTLSLAGRVEGDGNTPRVSATLEGPRLTFAGRDLGATHLEGRIVGRELQVWGKPFRDAEGSARVHLEEPFPFDASLALALPEIKPLLPERAIARGLRGSLSGVVSARGTVREPGATRASAVLDKLELARGDFAGHNDAPVTLAWSQGRLEVQSFSLRGPDTELSVAGWVGPEALDLTLRGALDMRLLESFVPALERTGGRMELDAVASGRLSDPALLGHAHLRDARFSLRATPLAARGLSGRLEFSQQRVLLEELRGTLNEGRVAVRGDVWLERFEPRRLELGLHLEEVGWRLPGDLPLTASGDLLLAGAPEALTLSGNLTVVRLHYDRGLELEDVLGRLSQRSVLPASQERPRELVALDVRLDLGDVRVDNNLGRARLRGQLRLTGTNARPGLLGVVETAEGSQAFFRNNQFAIRQGLLEFKDRHGIDAVLDVRAETLVRHSSDREYRVKLHAFGRPSGPQVLLTSEPALPEADILSLLTLGVTSTDRDTAASASAGLAAEALFSVSGLDRQVQRFLPRNPVLRDLSFQISTTYNDATSQVEPTAQLESRLLSDQLRLSMQQPVSGRGRRAQAEYRFDEKLSAQAHWDNEHSDVAIGNLGLELKLNWEVE